MNVKPLNVIDLTSDHHDDALTIAGKLTDWFNEQGLNDLAVDIRYQPGLAAMSDGQLVGFLTWFVTQGGVCIGWIAVDPLHHRQGAGKALLNKLVVKARLLQIDHIRVWTLSQFVDYEPYNATRAFYQAMGFKAWKRLPGYCDDGSEMEIYQFEVST